MSQCWKVSGCCSSRIRFLSLIHKWSEWTQTTAAARSCLRAESRKVKTSLVWLIISETTAPSLPVYLNTTCWVLTHSYTPPATAILNRRSYSHSAGPRLYRQRQCTDSDTVYMCASVCELTRRTSHSPSCEASSLQDPDWLWSGRPECTSCGPPYPGDLQHTHTHTQHHYKQFPEDPNKLLLLAMHQRSWTFSAASCGNMSLKHFISQRSCDPELGFTSGLWACSAVITVLAGRVTHFQWLAACGCSG